MVQDAENIETARCAHARRMRALCSRLGNVQTSLRVIHVAGTNGKGSVCRYCYEVLRAHGYSVGLFTSPFVETVCERIEFNDEMIAAEELTCLLARVERAADPKMTEFEIMTVAAFLYFAEKQLDFVVLEAGLGGARDATNVIEQPLVTVITNVALDHMDRLGTTIEQIAEEKAGIIKYGCPVVTGATGSAARIIADTATQLNAPLVDATHVAYDITHMSLDSCTFDVRSEGKHYCNIELSMSGEHQIQNAITALNTLEVLETQGFITLESSALLHGFKHARLSARLQIVSQEPLIIVDGAHNTDGARVLTKTLKDLIPNGRLLFVCSFLADKAVEAMLAEFAQLATAFIASGSNYAQVVNASALAHKMQEKGYKVLGKAATPAQAYALALSKAAEFDAVIFAGSLYTAGAVIQEARMREA